MLALRVNDHHRLSSGVVRRKMTLIVVDLKTSPCHRRSLHPNKVISMRSCLVMLLVLASHRVNIAIRIHHLLSSSLPHMMWNVLLLLEPLVMMRGTWRLKHLTFVPVRRRCLKLFFILVSLVRVSLGRWSRLSKLDIVACYVDILAHETIMVVSTELDIGRESPHRLIIEVWRSLVRVLVSRGLVLEITFWEVAASRVSRCVVKVVIGGVRVLLDLVLLGYKLRLVR